MQQGGVVEFPLTTSGNFARSNKLKVTGALAINGGVLSLDISNAPQIANDKSFALFDLSGATVSGTGFSSIEPARPSETQVWDISELLTTGRIYVRADENSAVGTMTMPADDPAQAYSLGGVSGARRGIVVKQGKKFLTK